MNWRSRLRIVGALSVLCIVGGTFAAFVRPLDGYVDITPYYCSLGSTLGAPSGL